MLGVNHGKVLRLLSRHHHGQLVKCLIAHETKYAQVGSTMTKGHVNNPKSLGLGVSKNLLEGCIEGGELVLKEGKEQNK
jgi:hypothetical protein